jgi:hypothetical protein
MALHQSQTMELSSDAGLWAHGWLQTFVVMKRSLFNHL